MKTKCLYPSAIINNETLCLIEISRVIVVDGKYINIDRKKKFLKKYLYGFIKDLPKPNTDESSSSWTSDLIIRHAQLDELSNRFQFVHPNKKSNRYKELCPIFTISCCSRCIFCRHKKQNEWSLRIRMECNQYDYKPYFVTLTYDPDHTPQDFIPFKSGLSKRHLQLFIKRLRRHIADEGFPYQIPEFGLRYFACGEYGGKRGRMHYHLILFNCPHPFGDSIMDLRWLSSLVRLSWDYGDLGCQHRDSRGYPGKDLDIKLCDSAVGYYVSKYVAKCTTDDGVYEGQKPFILYSRCPGLGFLPAWSKFLIDAFRSAPDKDTIQAVDKWSNSSYDIPLNASVSRRVYPSKCVLMTKLKPLVEFDNPKIIRYKNLRTREKIVKRTKVTSLLSFHESVKPLELRKRSTARPFAQYSFYSYRNQRVNYVNVARNMHQVCVQFLAVGAPLHGFVNKSMRNHYYDKLSLLPREIHAFFKQEGLIRYVLLLKHSLEEDFPFISFDQKCLEFPHSINDYLNLMDLVDKLSYNEISEFKAEFGDWSDVQQYFCTRETHMKYMAELSQNDYDLVGLNTLRKDKEDFGKSLEVF